MTRKVKDVFEGRSARSCMAVVIVITVLVSDDDVGDNDG